MMLRGYGEDDERSVPLQEPIPVPGQELVFAGPGVPEAALKIREEREVAAGPLQEPLPKDHAEAQ